MAQLRRDYPRFVQRGAVVIAIGPEDEETFTRWWILHRMPFLGIPDPKHKIAERYGQQVRFFQLGRLPEVVVIDKQGYIRLKHRGVWMSDIPTNRELLKFIEEINQEETGEKKPKKG
jgi:peroxiredoxin Q/BCP